VTLPAVRRGAAGVWYRGQDGTGLLVVDATLLAADGALDRLVQRVLAVRALAGLVPIADLAADGDRILLMAGAPVSPVALDLPASFAAAVATDTASALLALHGAGLTHGSFGPECVVVTASGVALVNEAGLATALAGREGSTVEDVRQWAAFVRTLANAWAGADADEADALARVAMVAETSGLGAALNGLRERWPAPARPALVSNPVEAAPASAPGLTAAAAPGLSAASAPGLPAAPQSGLPAAAAPGQMATMLGRRAAASGPPPTESTVETPLRFGPGVPASVGSVWRGAPPVRRRRRRFLSVLATLVVVLLVLGFLWYRVGGPLSVTGVSVAAAQPAGQACDVAVDVVGTIHTDGRGGAITYQWLRNDGSASAVLHDMVAPGRHDVAVHLRWEFSGHGTYAATATLSVLAPDPTTAKADFTYAC
jgi:hypothetical protein